MTHHRFLVTAPRGITAILYDELRELGVTQPHRNREQIWFDGSIALGYRVCLWSRLASRVILFLRQIDGISLDSLRDGIKSVPWQDHLHPDGRLRVDFVGTNDQIRHTLFGAQMVKDALVDSYRDRGVSRPTIDLDQPDHRIHVRIDGHRATIGLDLSAGGLHRRGYRLESGAAPLRENLAAALLRLAGWRFQPSSAEPLLDPLCGSGTFLIEAGMMAADIAPGLNRQGQSLSHWLDLPDALRRQMREEMVERAQNGLHQLDRMQLPLIGFELDELTVAKAQANLARAGLTGQVHIEQNSLQQLLATIPPQQLAGVTHGLLLTNPPYGHRTGSIDRVHIIQAQLHELLSNSSLFRQWRGAVINCAMDDSPTPFQTGTGWQAEPSTLHNGPLACQLWLWQPRQQHQPVPATQSSLSQPGSLYQPAVVPVSPPPAVDLANRLRNNQKRLKNWLRREAIQCYRLYDADLPEYAVAVDIYGDRVHIQEYQAPATIEPAKAAERLQQVLVTVSQVLEVSPSHIHLKQRAPQKGANQYGKMADTGQLVAVAEDGLQFLVNLSDYLDSGLFLDHRRTRAMIRSMAAGRSFLNLFGYTGSATVYAAAGGARSTTTVDLSRTYLDWARRNMALNGFQQPHHELIQADCLLWIAASEASYDLIFLDPPTFSNSKRMRSHLDLQRDHVALLMQTMGLLNPDGILLFSSNYARFRLDRDALPDGWRYQDLSRATRSPDFDRKTRYHHCWRIERMAHKA
ncbi:MAG: bifunctional 23S rRNA (guanine(2069)-N(7))-methyltransferase RlmK/23S rRNA (guanine(2445)-N(2))-methyltransferase RlmL [Magnetococcales bacterium]|nr:bifunctional 23S rRNA (guanine(2069)-N(7))-methyltransferase RlmK/23S rRNA (guanine(2445)-N(2))-methyltransferase RlmL [Magnetococcales bacterium]